MHDRVGAAGRRERSVLRTQADRLSPEGEDAAARQHTAR
jgi:hypothetical protein